MARTRQTRPDKEQFIDDNIVMDSYFLQSHEEFRGEPDMKMRFDLAAHPNYMVYFPEDFGLGIPKKGCWILVRQSPHAEYTVPVLSMWYAKPHEGHSFRGYPMKLARIITPNGELMLLPQEYVKVTDISKYLEWLDDGVEIHYLSENAKINPDLLFYIQSRGITKQDAILLAINELRDQHYCYFQVDQRYADYFGLQVSDDD